MKTITYIALFGLVSQSGAIKLRGLPFVSPPGASAIDTAFDSTSTSGGGMLPSIAPPSAVGPDVTNGMPLLVVPGTSANAVNQP
tara:strand:- start:403 stop:654 length:252 start_codon:yes stop_codon:yes gene_type:complete